MRRTLGVLFGLGTQVFFALTAWRLFFFLKGESAVVPAGALWIDVLLSVQFGVVHSVLLYPRTRQTFARWIDPAFYGCFYCVATCLTLWSTFGAWQGASGIIWEWQGTGRALVLAGFIGSWISLFYSLALTGLGYQTGFTPWWYWLRRRPSPPREFRVRGAYRWLRHPVYLSFLGLLWFAPVMSYDRAVLTGVWTLYILVGSYLKDRRLVFFLGDTYRNYQARVAGYPFMVAGPLGKVALPPCPAAASTIVDTRRVDRFSRSGTSIVVDPPCRSSQGDTVCS